MTMPDEATKSAGQQMTEKTHKRCAVRHTTEYRARVYNFSQFLVYFLLRRGNDAHQLCELHVDVEG